MRLNDLDFHIEVEGDGPPLLLLHGFTGSVRAWDQVRPLLAASAQVIAIDLIGHGCSAAPREPGRYSLDWCTRDLAALLDALELDSVHLLGYSMGGRAALHFAVHAPERVRSLILESASPGIADAAERRRRAAADEALAERILEAGVDAFAEEWQRLPLLQPAPHVSSAVREHQHRQRRRNDALGLANSLRGMGAGQMASLWSCLPALTLPVVLIVGALDSRYCAIAQRTAARLSAGGTRIVQAAGHTVHLDQPAQFVRLVRATIR